MVCGDQSGICTFLVCNRFKFGNMVFMLILFMVVGVAKMCEKIWNFVPLFCLSMCNNISHCFLLCWEFCLWILIWTRRDLSGCFDLNDCNGWYKSNFIFLGISLCVLAFMCRQSLHRNIPYIVIYNLMQTMFCLAIILFCMIRKFPHLFITKKA